MRTHLLTATLVGAGLLASASPAGAERCFEDEPCWDASTMGNRTGWQDGVWYIDGEPTEGGYEDEADQMDMGHGWSVPGSVQEQVSLSSYAPAAPAPTGVQLGHATRTSTAVDALGLGYHYTVAQHQAIADLLAWGAPADERTALLVDLWMRNLLTLAEVYEVLA